MCCAKTFESMAYAGSKRNELVSARGLHRALELGRMRLERMQLRVDERRDILEVVGSIRFPQQHRVRAMRGQRVLGKEVWISRGDHRVACKEPGVTMVGMQSIALPRVMAKNDIGSDESDTPCDLAT